MNWASDDQYLPSVHSQYHYENFYVLRLALLVFTGWIVGLMFFTVGALIHLLLLQAMFMIAMGTEQTKKHRLYLSTLK